MVPHGSWNLETKMAATHLISQVVRAGEGGSFNLSREPGCTLSVFRKGVGSEFRD